jgi:hypothetical protein
MMRKRKQWQNNQGGKNFSLLIFDKRHSLIFTAFVTWPVRMICTFLSVGIHQTESNGTRRRQGYTVRLERD